MHASNNTLHCEQCLSGRPICILLLTIYCYEYSAYSYWYLFSTTAKAFFGLVWSGLASGLWSGLGVFWCGSSFWSWSWSQGLGDLIICRYRYRTQARLGYGSQLDTSFFLFSFFYSILELVWKAKPARWTRERWWMQPGMEPGRGWSVGGS